MNNIKTLDRKRTTISVYSDTREQLSKLGDLSTNYDSVIQSLLKSASKPQVTNTETVQ
jgi:hypothetical protein